MVTPELTEKNKNAGKPGVKINGIKDISSTVSLHR